MFHGVSFRLLHNPPLSSIQALFARLRQDGCDAISIIPHHYVSLQQGTPNLCAPPSAFNPAWFIYPDTGQDPTHPFHNTPEPELVLDTCKAAVAAGFRVMLKPHIDSYQAGWRGDISVKDHAADWDWGYRNRFLARYVDIAKQIDGAILCLGCELYTVTKELGPAFWINVAGWVRARGFTGPLTYAANWGGWSGDAEYRRLADLWPHLDYIGVDAYYPLLPQGYSGPEDLATFVAAWHRKGIDVDWCPRIDDDLLDISKTTGKPLLFTEIGYANHQQAPFNPMRDPVPTDVRDDDLQLRLAQAFRQRWLGEPAFDGYFWWEAWLDSATKTPISHDILDRPIEKVIFQPPAGAPGPVGPPTPDPAALLAINGLHGPNCAFADFRSVPGGPAEGADAAWRRVAAAQVKWIKLLWPDHHRADAQRARSLGLKVLVRVPGEGVTQVKDVQAAIAEFSGVCDVIELGNEPAPTAQYTTWDQLYWNHAWYLESIWNTCAPAAHAAHIMLCTPGWQAAKEPPTPDSLNSQALSDRLRQVYGLFDAIGVHCYDPFNLAIPPVLERIDRWQAVFRKPIYITEYGIAARFLVPNVNDPAQQPQSDLVKATRYAAFLGALATRPAVKAAFLFLLGGTNDYAAFRGGGYDPQGNNSYWLAEPAYTALASTLVSGSRDLGGPPPPPDLGGHIGVGDRPHGPDYPVCSVPTISPALFASVLVGYGSPVLREAEAAHYYETALDAGVNPAVALAFFEEGSRCGTAGPLVAAGGRNWGHLRPRTDGTLGRAYRTLATPDGAFRDYLSYLDSLRDWCDLMRADYGGMGVREAFAAYAPIAADPESAALTMLGRLAEWDAASGAFDLPEVE